jgi:hypothetical protein
MIFLSEGRAARCGPGGSVKKRFYLSSRLEWDSRVLDPTGGPRYRSYAPPHQTLIGLGERAPTDKKGSVVLTL